MKTLAYSIVMYIGVIFWSLETHADSRYPILHQEIKNWIYEELDGERGTGKELAILAIQGYETDLLRSYHYIHFGSPMHTNRIYECLPSIQYEIKRYVTFHIENLIGGGKDDFEGLLALHRKSDRVDWAIKSSLLLEPAILPAIKAWYANGGPGGSDYVARIYTIPGTYYQGIEDDCTWLRRQLSPKHSE